MASLQKNKYSIVFLFSFFLNGCATSRYEVSKPNAMGTDIKVTPDRIITECEFIADYDGDRKNPFGFMIHLLDLENSVLTVSNGIVLEKEDCLERQSITDKIIKNATLVTVRGRGDADSPIVKSEFTFLFKKHSTYFGNGRSLNFLAIWNDKRDCHSIFNEKDDPCLRLNHHLNE